MKDFKKYKLQILFSGLLTLFSISLNAQCLRKNMILISLDAGYLHQKVNISSQYSPFKIKTNTDGNKHSQWFFGLEIGRNRLQNQVSTYFNQGSFKMQAEGVHLAFMATKVITKNLKRKENKFSYTSTTFKVSFNHFNNVKSHPWHDTYYEEYDYKTPEKAWITNAKTRAVDFELHFSEHIRFNSYNFLKLTIYTGIRIGSTSGTEHRMTYDWDYQTVTQKWFSSEKNYTKNINPIILGLSLGYQINLGRKPSIK